VAVLCHMVLDHFWAMPCRSTHLSNRLVFASETFESLKRLSVLARPLMSCSAAEDQLKFQFSEQVATLRLVMSHSFEACRMLHLFCFEQVQNDSPYSNHGEVVS